MSRDGKIAEYKAELCREYPDPISSGNGKFEILELEQPLPPPGEAQVFPFIQTAESRKIETILYDFAKKSYTFASERTEVLSCARCHGCW